MLPPPRSSSAPCACDGQKAGETATRVDPTVLRGEWFVSALNGGPAVPQTPDPISIVFEDEELSGVGKLRGFAGVNRFFGAYTATPTGTLEVGTVGSTRSGRPARPPGVRDDVPEVARPQPAVLRRRRGRDDRDQRWRDAAGEAVVRIPGETRAFGEEAPRDRGIKGSRHQGIEGSLIRTRAVGPGCALEAGDSRSIIE